MSRIVRRDPQHGRADRAPDRVDVLHPVHGRETEACAADRRAAAPCRRAALRAQCGARNSALSRGSRGLFFCRRSATAARSRYGANAGGSRSASSHLRELAGAASGASPGMPKPSSDTTVRDALRAARRRRCIATLPPRLWPAMSTRSSGANASQQRVEIGDVVVEPVAVCGATREQAEAAPDRARARATRARARRPGTGTTRTTSIQPCSRKSLRARGSPHVRTW